MHENFFINKSWSVLFSEKKLFRETRNRRSVGIPAISRNGKPTEFRSAPFWGREKSSEFRSVPIIEAKNAGNSEPNPSWNASNTQGGQQHCINSKSYTAQKSVSINSGPDSIVMHSFIARYCFCKSSKMLMNTSLFNGIWHAKAVYSREIHRLWLY